MYASTYFRARTSLIFFVEKRGTGRQLKLGYLYSIGRSLMRVLLIEVCAQSILQLKSQLWLVEFHERRALIFKVGERGYEHYQYQSDEKI